MPQQLLRLTSYSHNDLSAILGSTTERALAKDASKKSVLFWKQQQTTNPHHMAAALAR
jgi:hypothetical protein